MCSHLLNNIGSYKQNRIIVKETTAEYEKKACSGLGSLLVYVINSNYENKPFTF